MSSPLPPHIKRVARKVAPKSTAFEYIKFWAPFILMVGGACVMVMSRIAVMESTIKTQTVTIQKLEEKTLGKDVLQARHEACQGLHQGHTRTTERLEAKIDRHVEKSGGR